MDNSDSSEQEVSEEMHYKRLQSLFQLITGTSDDITRIGLELLNDCWFHNFFNKSRYVENMPFDFKQPDNVESLLQLMHCHYTKAPCCDCWRKSSVYNLGLKETPEEKWDRWAELYRMHRWPRGNCIIIANIVFGGLAEEREGCLEDVKRMRALFLALHFNCTVATNLKAEEMKTLLKWAAEECDEDTDDCLVVVLMSHGKENYIYGADFEPLHLYYDVYEQFNNDNCGELKGKPKLFFVQACRGGNYNCGVNALPKNFDSGSLLAGACNTSSDPKAPKRRYTWSDMYNAYATIPGYVALRNEESGSWFVSAIYEVFLEHAHTDSLAKLMRRVHDVILVRASEYDDSRQTPCTEQFGWRRKLHFFPERMYSSRFPRHSRSCCCLKVLKLSTWDRIFNKYERKAAEIAKSREAIHVEDEQSSLKNDAHTA